MRFGVSPTGYRQPATVHSPPSTGNRSILAQRRSGAMFGHRCAHAHRYGQADHRPPATAHRQPATGYRQPSSALRSPSSAIRIGVHLCPSVVNLSVHRFPEFMRSGFFEIAPIPDPSILPRATAQRRDAQTSGKASVVSNRGELCGVSPSPAARGGGRTGGILLRSSARRHPPSVHCPPATAHRQPISRATTPRRDVQASKRSRASLRPSRVGRSPLRGHKKAPARAGALETD